MVIDFKKIIVYAPLQEVMVKVIKKLEFVSYQLWFEIYSYHELLMIQVISLAARTDQEALAKAQEHIEELMRKRSDPNKTYSIKEVRKEVLKQRVTRISSRQQFKAPVR